MLITGNRILDALDMLKERVKSLDTQFKPSLYRFEDESADEKRDPRDIVAEFEKLHERIARLQEVQAAYNLRVEVDVLGEQMTLQRILHLIGSASRVKAHWLSASAPEEQNIYAINPLRQRDKEHEYAKRVVPLAEAQQLADHASRRALALKQAIRSANAREVEMEAPEDLFEQIL
jgi:hypothetical protein